MSDAASQASVDGTWASRVPLGNGGLCLDLGKLGTLGELVELGELAELGELGEPVGVRGGGVP